MNADMVDLADSYYTAFLARDPRFDGKFFVGVTTTGIYCRPICPAKPHGKNVTFFDSSHAAEQAGYRPCLRCRPEAAPLSPAWYGTSALVQRALRRILEAGLCNETEETFAAHFGVTSRHLRRLFTLELGKTPKQVYQEQRLALARKLLVETHLPITEIAYAAGFQSIRRFNDAFQKRFLRAPTQVRTEKQPFTKGFPITLRLSYRPPLAWEALLSFLRQHALPDIEFITNTDYIRYYKTNQGAGRVRVTNDSLHSTLVVTFEGFDSKELYDLVQRIRRLFDLDADPLLIAQAIERSPLLRHLQEQKPGIRAPGVWDAFETAVLLVLQHQALPEQTQLWAHLLQRQYGESLSYQAHTFALLPTPRVLAEANLSLLPIPQEKKRILTALSHQVQTGALALVPYQNPQRLQEQLLSIVGMPPWVASSIVMRCLHNPDGFPVSDPVLQDIEQNNPCLYLQQATPWRAYAAHLLWATYASPLFTNPPNKGEPNP